VRDILTLMSTCGMYNYAGQWAFEVGIPAKSGVAGGIFAVIPGQAGIAVYSPLLDEHGNSIRGVEACKALSREFSLHFFSDHTNVATTIRREVRGSDLRSKRLRSSSEQELLTREGTRIAVLEVQGALYFGSTELLIRRISALTSECDDLIVDFKRVSFADGPARRLIHQTVLNFPYAEKTLTFAGIAEDGPLADMALALGAEKSATLRFAEDNDQALEFCEDRLLETFVDGTDRTRFALGKLDLFRGVSRDDLSRLETIVSTFQYDKGQQIIREGDLAAMFYVVARGSVSIAVSKPDGQRRRLSAAGPGQAFGEIALVDGGRRTADVYAEQTTICYGFPVDDVRALAKTHPDLMPTILANMVRGLTMRLGQANEEIRSLL
jgi:glutaminase